jgi:phosphoglycerate dehydrogenase-like enzyme
LKKLAVTFSPLTTERLQKIKNAAPNFEVLPLSPKDEQLLDCEVIFGQISPKLFNQPNKIKWLHTQSSGVNFLLTPDVSLPEELLLTNSAGAYGLGISEHLLTVTMMLLRQMSGYHEKQKAHDWSDIGKLKTIHGSTVTIVGLGDIGGHFAKHCKNLGATVRGVVRTPRTILPENVDALFTVDELDKAINGADVVVLSLPGTNETQHLFNHKRLGKMKKGAILLNVGRGNAIDTEALIEHLKSGQIGGAGLDVTDPEPLPISHELWDLPNVVLTPHISGNDSLDITHDLIVDKFVRYLQDYLDGKPFEKTVDKKAGY